MKQIFSGLTIVFFITFLSTNGTAQCGKNFLKNSGFELPEQTLVGNNAVVYDAIQSWNIEPANASLSDKICFIIKTNGNSFTNGPDEAVDGNQYFCLKNDKGTISQDFTITAEQEVNYAGFFSSKEQNAGYINWTAGIDIVNIASNTVVSTSTTKDFDKSNGFISAQEKWYYIFGNAILPVGNYRFVIHLGQFGNFDAAFLGSKCILASNAMQLKGNYTNEKILLQWSAPAQNENTLFVVEKSNNGKDFASISTVPFSADVQYYFTDKTPFINAKNFYRIKKINTNGSAAYSNILIISTKQNPVIMLYPNPVQDQLVVSGLPGKGDIVIKDIAGRTVIKRTAANAQSFTINVSSLNKGMYLLHYFDGKESTVVKFSKQ